MEATKVTPRPVLESPRAYRQLSQAELALMDEIRAHAERTRDLVNRVQSFVNDRSQEPLPEGHAPHSQVTNPGRWASIGQTELQQGFMALARAVAQPSFF